MNYIDVFNNLKPNKPLRKKVMIVDGLNTFIRCFSNVPTLSDNGIQIGAINGFLMSIGKVIRDFQVTHCVLVFDGKGGSQNRRKIYSEYKANRKMKTDLNRLEHYATAEEERESFKYQLALLVEMMQYLPLKIVTIDNIEADDSIAFITKNFYDDFDKLIVSTDKDFLQLVSEDVSVWSPVKKKLYTPQSVSKDFGIPFYNLLTWRIFDGDSTDNINGIKGMGIKTFIKTFPKILNEKLSWEDIYEQSTNTKSKSKISEAVINGKEILERNYKLMQLDDVNISAHAKFQISDILKDNILPYNKTKFLKILLENRFSITNNASSWFDNTFSVLYANRQR